MIAAFDSMMGGTIFDASQASSDDLKTPKQNPFGDECHLKSSRDRDGVTASFRKFSVYHPPQNQVFTSHLHYKIKRKGGETDKSKVRLVVQGQHMRRKGNDGVGEYHDAFSPVPAASGLSLATQQNEFTDHVDMSQSFVQGELLPGDGHNGKVYISSPLGYDEDPLYTYCLPKPLYGIPSAARAWHTTTSVFLAIEGCATAGSERARGPSRWTVLASY